MKHPSPTPAHGFTLIEVMISLGIFAFAIVVVIGSLGTSGNSAANDARRTLTVEILHHCFHDLDLAKSSTSDPSPTLALAPIPWDAKPARLRLWFDASGQRVADAKQAFFRCDLTPTRDPALPLGHLHGRIVWPAKRLQGAPDGDAELFTSLLLP